MSSSREIKVILKSLVAFILKKLSREYRKKVIQKPWKYEVSQYERTLKRVNLAYNASYASQVNNRSFSLRDVFNCQNPAACPMENKTLLNFLILISIKRKTLKLGQLQKYERSNIREQDRTRL